MSVLSTTLWRPHPGRTGDVIKTANDARLIHERRGGRVTVTAWSYAGDRSGTLGYTVMFPDLVAFGKFSDALVADEEWRRFNAERIDIPDAPGTPVSQHLAVDQPGFETQEVSAGTFLLVQQLQLKPGRTAAEVLSLAADVRALILECGATQAVMQRVLVGGTLTSLFVGVIAFASAESYAQSVGRYAGDPRGQALLERLMGPDSPVNVVSSSTGRVLAR